MKLDEAVEKLTTDNTLSREERWTLLMQILKLMSTKVLLLESVARGKSTRRKL